MAVIKDQVTLTHMPVEQNYQSQDVWSRATSVNGYPFDELRSVLQKSIRRGLMEEAVLAAYEFFSSGPEAEEVLWRRLEIIATEDVGFGLIEAPAILEALNSQRLRMADRGDRWMYSVHAVRLLASAKKDNTTMELACWAQFAVARGERKVEVQDFHVDMHTRRGVELGRDVKHWWTQGAKLENRISDEQTPWGKYLDELYMGGQKS
jgi:replication-associated recombination protein RarA